MRIGGSLSHDPWIGLTRGSRHEGDEWPGIAHFVEHMLFKGTTTRSAEDIAQTVDSVGGQMDASTGKENANYAIKVLDERFAGEPLRTGHPRRAGGRGASGTGSGSARVVRRASYSHAGHGCLDTPCYRP